MLKVGIVGAGKIIENVHIPILREHFAGQVELSGIYSPTGKTAKTLQTRFQIPKLYDEPEDVLNDPSDVLLIAVPIHAVSEWLDRARETGRLVFCEKPAIANRGETTRFSTLTPEENEKLFIAENQLFFDSYIHFSHRLKSGEFGTVKAFNYRVERFYSEANDIYLRAKWRTSPQHTGGYLYDYGMHHFSVLYRLLDGLSMVEGRMHGVGDYDRYPSALEWKLRCGQAEGLFALDYHSEQPVSEFYILTDRGRIEVERGRVDFFGDDGSHVGIYNGIGDLYGSYLSEWRYFFDMAAGKITNPHPMSEALEEALAFFDCFEASVFE